MKAAAEGLRNLLQRVPAQLSSIDDDASAKPLAPGKWSRKQILGHLIDSASNNHQRFVRAQLAESLTFPSYAQNEWIAAQQYQSEPWGEMVRLWASYNFHLAHVLSNIPAEKGNCLCKIGDGEPVTLSRLAEDYVQHMKRHLEQILA